MESAPDVICVMECDPSLVTAAAPRGEGTDCGNAAMTGTIFSAPPFILHNWSLMTVSAHTGRLGRRVLLQSTDEDRCVIPAIFSSVLFPQSDLLFSCCIFEYGSE
jgi:hypothetical protein